MQNSNGQNIISLQNKSEDELMAIAEEYPFYAPAQLQLLSNYKKNNHSNFEKQASITALFFNNQKWLNYQLEKDNFIEEEIESEDTKEVAINDYLPEEMISEKEITTEENITTEEEAKEPEPPVILAEPISSQNTFTVAEPSDNVQENIKEELAFEPLFMVDYFASQGIKITEEALNKDKLGTQLKSFTEWLKSMKKIHTEKQTENDEQTDKVIRHIAESSNTDIDVVTEAMAEVLAKQGKAEQAIDMYRKLSLNYPLRSGYFAAKIKSLKTV